MTPAGRRRVRRLQQRRRRGRIYLPTYLYIYPLLLICILILVGPLDVAGEEALG